MAFWFGHNVWRRSYVNKRLSILYFRFFRLLCYNVFLWPIIIHFICAFTKSDTMKQFQGIHLISGLTLVSVIQLLIMNLNDTKFRYYLYLMRYQQLRIILDIEGIRHDDSSSSKGYLVHFLSQIGTIIRWRKVSEIFQKTLKGEIMVNICFIR